MWNLNAAIVTLSLLVRSTFADDDNVFTNPTSPGPSGDFAKNPAWTPGSVQRISWKTTLDTYKIALFHQKGKSGSGDQVRVVHTLDSNGSGDQYFDWTVDTYGTSTASSSAFYFAVESGSSDGYTSHYFNVTSGASTTTTRRTTSTSPSPTISSTAAPRKITTTTTSAHHASKTAAAAAAAPKSKSKPKSRKSKYGSPLKYNPRYLGLAVGLGLGIPILIIGAVFAFYAIKLSRPVQRIIERRRQLSEAKKNAVPVWCPDERVFKYSAGSAC